MKWLVVLLALVCSYGVRAEELISLVMSEVRLVDLVRVAYGELERSPFVLSHELLELDQRFTVDLRQVTTPSAVSAVSELARSVGFTVDKRGGVVWVGKSVAPEDELIVYRPRYRSARYLSDVVQSVTAARSVLSRSLRQADPTQTQPAQGQSGSVKSPPSPAPQKTPSTQSSPSSVEGQIDRSEVDQIAFSVAAKEVGKVNKLLQQLDTAPGEVVLKAAVYEVGVNKREGSAVNVLASLLNGRIGGSVNGGLLDGVSLKLSLGGLEAVLSALDADVRFKSVSRPQVRVRNGAQARFSVGQDVPVLGNIQVDKTGNAVQSVDYKQSGVILTVTPEIREEVIELSLVQELSNFVVTKTGVNNSPTLIKRAVNTKLGLVPGEVVVLAGLQDDQDDETINRVPFMGWMFGQDKQQKRSEILVFIEAQRI